MAACLVALLLPIEAQCATFTVTNRTDSGPGSLRQAIINANTAPGADTIVFRKELTGTIRLTTGELTITDTLTIKGPGASRVAVSGNDTSRVFMITFGTNVEVLGITITHGRASGFDDDGGGINNAGTLTLRRSKVALNRAESDGGGINNTGILTLRDCEVSGNSSEGDAGGIENSGMLILEDSEVERNSAEVTGGGIRNLPFGTPSSRTRKWRRTAPTATATG
jgi:hypothetical protein